MPRDRRSGGRSAGRSPALLSLLLAPALLAGLGGLTLAGVGHLEGDNDLCIRCHVGGRPLHLEQHRQVATGRGGTLAARHATVRVGPGAGRGIRCIDCHAGPSLGGRLRLQGTAFLDLLVYVSGRAEEPSGLTSPMTDAHCTGCHAGATGGRFHSIPAHAAGLPVRCTECHPAHRAGPGPAATPAELARAQCARCHPGLGEPVRRVAAGLPPRPGAP